MSDSYTNWLSYCRGLTVAQLRNVYAVEKQRLELFLADDVRWDSTQAVSACRVVAASLGIELD